MTSWHSFIAFCFGDSSLLRQNEPSATHFYQIRISHVFEDVSWEGDADSPEGNAPSVLDAYPQK